MTMKMMSQTQTLVLVFSIALHRLGIEAKGIEIPPSIFKNPSN